MSGGWQVMVPETGRRVRARILRALPFCLIALFLLPASLLAQTLTSDLFNPSPDGFAAKQNPRRTAQNTPSQNTLNDASGNRSNDEPASSRIGAIPGYGTPAASGAGVTGYDSLGRRTKQTKRTKPRAAAVLPAGTRLRGAVGGAVPATGDAALPPVPAGPVPTTPPKIALPPSSAANFTPVSPSLAGTIAGQPPRRRLKIDDDPFGAVGIYYGSFLSKAAVELSGGYDTNPGRILPARGSAFYAISPELLIASDWERHSLVADLRGSYTGYGSTIPADISASSGAPTTLNRPDFTGKIDGRFDVTRDTRIDGELRLRIATDNPGSPNIQTGLARYPVYATFGTTLGFDHDFNRLNVALGATVDHTSYQWSQLTDGTISSNDDRDFTQYGGIARVGYDWRPGVKPFIEVEGDTRIHDQPIDSFGYQRDSNGGYVKAGSTFELSRLITGEMAIGWSTRTYQDPRLQNISGFLPSGSLIWTVTPLTTAKLIATSSIDESPLPGVAGVLTRDYLVEVDHAFRRWLIATAKFGYGTSNYEGLGRFDNRYTVATDLIYKLNRTYQIKGELRHDWLDSNVVGASTQATIVTLGVRAQQ